MRRFVYILFFCLLVAPIQVAAQSAKQYFRAGEEFFKEAGLPDAIAQYSKAIALDPEYEKAYVQRAKARMQLEEYDKAAEDFERALALNEKDAELYYLAGNSYHLLGQNDKAVGKLTRAIDIKGNYLEACQVRAVTYLELGHYQEALDDCRRCLRLKEDERGYFNLARTYERLKMYTEAESAYRKSIDKNEQLAETHFALAGLLYQREDLSPALNSVLEALQLDPGNLEGLLLKSRILKAQGNYPGAIEVLSLASVDHPRETDIYMDRGNCHLLMNQAAYSIIDYSTVLEIDPEFAEAYYRRAGAYENIRYFEKALADYAQLLELSEYNETAQRFREEAVARVFELNREEDKPELVLLDPVSGSNHLIDVPEGTRVLPLTGLIRDKSKIKTLQVNNFTVPLKETEEGFEFLASINLKQTDQVTIRVSDVYDNEETAIFAIRMTEVEAPLVQIIAPYGSENNILYLDSDEPNIHIEGRIRDESLIRKIFIDGVAASYIPSDLNPAFSAMVRVDNKSQISVEVEDAFGNRSKTEFSLSRGAQTFGDNPMGKTWAVFIENSNYASFASLEGPARDVTLMKAALAKYQVHNLIHKKDMSKQELERFFAIELRDLIRSNRVNSILIWYAGHGKYMNQTGYWIPVDAQRDDEFSYFSVNALKASMQSYPDFVDHTLVITDACESGPGFYQAMRSDLEERSCSDWEDTRFKSSQVFSSAGYEQAADNSQFTRTFSNTLANNPGECVSIERIVRQVTTAVTNSNQQVPQFGKIAGLEDENGTFFFIPKEY